MPSQRPWQLAGGLEHLYRHPGPDRPPHCTGAGEVPVNYLTAFSVYSCLPFGLCSAPSIFNNFASALHWVLENNYGASLLHYLDDFLLVDPPDQPTCQESMSTMLQVNETMGIPVATEKCEDQRPVSPSWALF